MADIVSPECRRKNVCYLINGPNFARLSKALQILICSAYIFYTLKTVKIYVLA